MADIPVSNPGTNPLHVRGYVIQPGETRILPEHQVPPRLRPDAGPATEPEPEGPDEVLQLLDQGVDKITPELPALSDTDLARLEQAEQDGKTRKTLMSAFQEERLRRAQERGQEPGSGEQDHISQILAHGTEAILPILSELPDADLEQMRAIEQAEIDNGDGRQAVVEALVAEQERRNGES